MKPWKSVSRVAVAALGLGLVLSASATERNLGKNLVFNSIEPCVILDTSKTAEGALQPGETRSFAVAGEVDLTVQGGESATGCGIPGFADGVAQANALVVNLIAKQPPGNGLLTAWASDRPMPASATLRFSPKSPWRNLAPGTIIPLRQDAAGEDFSLHASATVDVVATVVGYYSTMGLPEAERLLLEAGSAKLAAATETLGIRDTMTDLYVTHEAGVGTTDPGAQFEVSGVTSATGVPKLVFRNQVKAVGFASALQFGAGGTGPLSSANVPSDILAYVEATSPMRGALVLRTNRGASVEESLRVTGAGKVGIGTTTPGGKLDVRGGSASPGVYGESTATNGDGVFGRSDTGTGAYALRGYSVNGYGVNAYGGNYGGYFSGPKTYVSGNLGVGDNTPDYKLDVNGPANLNDGVASGIALLVNGAEALWYNGSYFSWGYDGTWNRFADHLFIDQLAGNSTAPSIGDRYRDNSVVAWAKVMTTGTAEADFGVASVTRNSAGNYTIVLDGTFAGYATLLPVASPEIDSIPNSAATVRFIAIDQINSTTFKVYVNNGSYAAVDNDFTFMVTGRP